MKYVLGPGPNGTIHCAIATVEELPLHIALIIHTVDPADAKPIGTIDNRFQGCGIDTLKDVTEIWFQNPRSVEALIDTLLDIRKLMEPAKCLKL